MERLLAPFSEPLFDGGKSGHDYRPALGSFIRTYRLVRGMTQAELAIAVRMQSEASIAAIELGLNLVPPERYMLFAEALGIAPDKFVMRLTRQVIAEHQTAKGPPGFPERPS